MKKQVVVLFMAMVISAVLIAGCTQNEDPVGPIQPTTPIPPSSQAPVVTTDTGAVSGIQQGKLRVFHNILFASPPTGDLRWRPPAPVDQCSGCNEVQPGTSSANNPRSLNRCTGDERRLSLSRCLDSRNEC